MSTKKDKNALNYPMAPWRGLGGWNFYFWLKFALLWHGILNFHPLTNLVFVAFLLFPISSDTLHRWRNAIAIPIGLALFYHDTWLPGLHSILSQGGTLFEFNANYQLELINRFINWEMIGVAFILLVAYLFISEWVRVTVFTVALLVWLNISAITGIKLPTNTTIKYSTQPHTTLTQEPSEEKHTLPPTNANLNEYLNQFYAKEKKRVTAFPKNLPADSVPFDLLIIQICSLAWADMYATQLDKHPLWSHFDLVFTAFNSAASYSGPAAIRLMRASCGQSLQGDLYKPAAPECYLFDNLAHLGFTTQLVLDHDGQFGNFLGELNKDGNMHAPLMSQKNTPPEAVSFEGRPVYNDADLLNQWLALIKQSTTPRSATFFNVIALHDGNRLSGQNGSEPYPLKGKKLFNALDNFFTTLEKSGRKVMVVVIPEHGMNLTGDKLQMSGLRDMPSESITHVPVGIKLIGMTAPYSGAPLLIKTPTSYLGLSDLISRLVDGKLFTAPTVDWSALTHGLPQTAIVSENEGIVVINYQGHDYIRLNGESSWTPYPNVSP